MTRARSLRAAAVALPLLLGACSLGGREEVAAVRAYDDALAAAFRTGELGGLRRVAGEDEARRVGVLVAMKGERRVVLESTLESFEVVRVDRPRPGAATVEARERWRYVDRPLDPGVAAPVPVVSTMTMRYALAREDGRLVVTAVQTLSSDGHRQAAPAAARH